MVAPSKGDLCFGAVDKEILPLWATHAKPMGGASILGTKGALLTQPGRPIGRCQERLCVMGPLLFSGGISMWTDCGPTDVPTSSVQGAQPGCT